MHLGKRVRLNRIFSHPSGRICSVAVDHWLGYSEGMPPGLRHIGKTLAAVMQGRPDAITIHKGMAAALWEPYAGQAPLIIQGSAIRPDDIAREQVATPEDAVRSARMRSPLRPSCAARPRRITCAWSPTPSVRPRRSRFR